MAIPNVAVGDLLRIRATAVLNGQTAVWGTDMRCSAVGGASLSVPALADQVAVLFDTNIPPTIGNQARVGSPIVELISVLTGRVLQSANGTSLIPHGTGGVTTAPTQAAAIVQKLTGLAGPRNRGRLYWPFLPTAFLQATGQISNGGRIAIIAAAISCWVSQTFSVGGDNVTVDPVLIHRYVVPAIPTYQPIVTFLMSLKIGTQKKRGDYGQPNPPT
jgi:hypothetical protein